MAVKSSVVKPTAKGRVAFGEYQTWYRVTGDKDGPRPALVVLHGGPGSTHDYLLNLALLAAGGWPVVHYDQLGNGGSTRLPGRGGEFWTPELFLAELDNLLRAVGVERDYVLFGHSWGGLLAAAHAARRPPGLRALIVADSPASYPHWLEELETLRAALPPETEAMLRKHEADGSTDAREYFDAAMVFNARHVCRLDPWPREYLDSFMEMTNDPTVYYAMNGPSEFHVVGSLKDWSVLDLLPRIAVPTLVITGAHDEVTPAAAEPFHRDIPGARNVVFEHSSHVPHLEEPERFLRVLAEFLGGLD